MNKLLTQFQQEYQRSNLLKGSVLIIPIILLAYLLVLSQASIQPFQQEYARLQKQQLKLQALENQADWQQELAKEQSKNRALTPFFWQAETLELGSADVQAALNKMTQLNLLAPTIKLAEPVWREDLNAWALNIEINGRLLEKGIQSLLLTLAEQQPVLSVENFSYSPARSGMMSLQLTALLTITQVHQGGVL